MAKSLALNAKARAWSRHDGDGNGGAPNIRNDGVGGFSKMDMAGPPGWLVAKGGLLYQAGGKTTRYGPLLTD